MPPKTMETDIRYDIFGRQVNFSQPYYYVTTTVANALKVFSAYQQRTRSQNYGEFEKADPINSAIITDWLQTHRGGMNAYLIEDNDLSGLVMTYR